MTEQTPTPSTATAELPTTGQTGARCARRWGRGWTCYLPRDHDGPCPLWPSWWRRVLRPSLRGMVRRG